MFCYVTELQLTNSVVLFTDMAMDLGVVFDGQLLPGGRCLSLVFLPDTSAEVRQELTD